MDVSYANVAVPTARSRNDSGVALLFVLVACLAAGRARAESPTLVDCDAAQASRTLAPAADTRTDARAYWLDARRLRWPGKPRSGHYALARSDAAALRLDAAQRLQGDDRELPLATSTNADVDIPDGFAFVPPGADLTLTPADQNDVREHLDAQWWLLQTDADGRVLDATLLQTPGLLDTVVDGEHAAPGPRVTAARAHFSLWAPTARSVGVCLYASADGPAEAALSLDHNVRTGEWTLDLDADHRGRAYAFLVDVQVPGVGLVRNRVTDPYAITLTADSVRSVLEDLDDPRLAPANWTAHARPAPAASNVDMSIYELHVRDFSVADASVPSAHRGRYLAFTDASSNGMRHMRALHEAGLTDVHLLPIFDFASVPERDCVPPVIAPSAPDSPAPQKAIAATAARDCYNWGYDPYHFGAPEGSYASDANDGAVRIREFRAMVQALHAAGLRVGMDVVYNHVHASGQAQTSVLDRIVPGYYLRLGGNGAVEHSTCCANTATEHRMMARLMADTLVRWARDYGIDSFRFDLMGHQPRVAMERAQHALRDAIGHDVPLIGEGWNYGEIANGSRFVQAAQGRLDGTHIGTFSDRARDALRGGGCCDSGADLVQHRGWLNGLADGSRTDPALARAADLVRVGLAGTLRDYPMTFADGHQGTSGSLDYAGQPAGYASAPDEVVNYVENHDNLTLFDVDALRLPHRTSRADRARVQALGVAMVALSQGVAYYHAGIDLLRSKSLDRNSYDSGDRFNRLDWTYTDNGFGAGLPPSADNGKDWPLLAPLLRDASIKPTASDIAWMRDVFRDWLRIRASTPLLRLRDGAEIGRRLTFLNVGASSDPSVIVGHLDGHGIEAGPFGEVLYLVNASSRMRTVDLPSERGKRYVLHPVQRRGVDARVRAARSDGRGHFVIPPRTAAVFVLPDKPAVAAGPVSVARAGAASNAVRIDDWHIAAPDVSPTPLHVRVFAARGALRGRATLYVNDGQDADAVGLADTVASLARRGQIIAPLVVAIDMPPDRMGAYGFSDRAAHRGVVAPTKYGAVGTRAQAYSEWLARVLVPWVEAHYPVRRDPASRALLGWSLGAANAFNVGWQYPEVFGRVGAFSPSFWLSTDPTDAASVRRTRIAQSMLAHGVPRDLRLFLAVGTDEETDDRDGDGVNDALDDVRELVEGAPPMPGLRQLGYRIESDAQTAGTHGDVALYELPGGIHRQSSWARMLPAFLRWAYGRDAADAGATRPASESSPRPLRARRRPHR